MAKIVDVGQALRPDHVSGAIWGAKHWMWGILEKNARSGASQIISTPYVGLSQIN